MFVNYLMLVHSPFSGFPAAQNNDWISFWGSVLGGLIGASVVILTFWKTIEYYRTKDDASLELEKEKIRLGIRPYFRMNYIDKYDDSVNINEHEFFLLGNDLLDQWESAFCVENIGLGTAIEVRYTYFDTVKNSYGRTGVAILIGEKRYVKFYVDQKHKTFYGFHHFMRVEYKDLLGNEYFQILEFVASMHGGEVTYCAEHYEKPILIKSAN